MVDVATLNDNKAIPPLREWELDSEDSTRYDKNLAAPSNETLKVYWMIWSTIALLSGIFTFTVFLGIITSRKAKKQTFNVFLIYLMIPDFTFSILCGITCLLNFIKGEYYSHVMCNIQQFYCVWGIGSNCWLNAIITYHLHSLLTSNLRIRKYQLPTPTTISYQALAVYVYCAFLGTWGLYNSDNFPYYAIQINGLACIPTQVNVPSSIFFWVFFMPIFSIIPTLYVAYVSYDIYKRKLLPPRGKRRLLAVYFGRIVLIFLLMWGPYFIFNYLISSYLPTIVIFLGGALAHLQGPLSAGVS